MTVIGQQERVMDAANMIGLSSTMKSYAPTYNDGQ